MNKAVPRIGRDILLHGYPPEQPHQRLKVYFVLFTPIQSTGLEKVQISSVHFSVDYIVQFSVIEFNLFWIRKTFGNELNQNEIDILTVLARNLFQMIAPAARGAPANTFVMSWLVFLQNCQRVCVCAYGAKCSKHCEHLFSNIIPWFLPPRKIADILVRMRLYIYDTGAFLLVLENLICVWGGGLDLIQL